MASVGPPAVKPTTMRTGLLGYPCAVAAPIPDASHRVASNTRKTAAMAFPVFVVAPIIGEGAPADKGKPRGRVSVILPRLFPQHRLEAFFEFLVGHRALKLDAVQEEGRRRHHVQLFQRILLIGAEPVELGLILDATRDLLRTEALHLADKE